MANSREEVVDLLILVDATSSMHRYLQSLQESLPQIISLSVLTNCFDRIGLLAYRDYCDQDLLEWSGWMTFDSSEEQSNLVKMASELHATGGGDYPEATKTGLAKAYEVMRPEAKTLLLLYTDAPPHMNFMDDNGYKNADLEQRALGPQSYGGYGVLFADWVSACHTLRSGEKKAQVMCVLSGYAAMRSGSEGFYEYLSSMTDGACIHLENNQARNISEVTMEMLLAWMGVKKEGASDVQLPAKFSYYRHNDVDRMASFQTEQDHDATNFFKNRPGLYVLASLSERFCTESLERRLPKKATPLQDFSKTYKASSRYRSVVTTQLSEIIQRDVAAISLNPVFGSLWRAFCNDRENDQRQELLDLFGRAVESMKDAELRAKMQTWLAESYDYTAEVLETVAQVPESLQYPCVCLDPTLVFALADSPDAADDDDDNAKSITAFRRDELLEIGRSCDGRILRRLGRVLTRLTFIESADATASHITSTNEAGMTRIPMALARPEYGRKFWRILLHIVVPGTMLSGRPAALLAALAIRLGVLPLHAAAETEMMLWRDRWNNIDVPETWNSSCISLLLAADSAYLNRQPSIALGPRDQEAGLLLPRDRELFTRLVDYKMLEINLNTTLHAIVAWAPQKIFMPIGPLFNCKRCHYPRSVTIMGPDGVCGLCCYYDAENQPEEERSEVHLRVSKEDSEATNAYWYECSTQTCRGQYIVYNVEGLRVRPKCHYCRNHQVAPLVECTKCLSCMIWPLEYRPVETSMSDFICVGCQSGRQTEIEIATSAIQLREENGESWLLQNHNNKIKQPFNNRTLYYIASNAAPLDDFCDRVQVLPARTTANLELRLQGKLIRNAQAPVEELSSWISRRRAEGGTCSLCFSDLRKNDLHPACGRSGCHQRICRGCLEGWYGLNAVGRIINTAALHCPFCRRAPTAKTLAKYGMGIHAVADLRDAVAQHGEWIYAWCAGGCGHARQYIERVCAHGAPPDLRDFVCIRCHLLQGAKVRTKPCPGCSVETEKTSGCDHITCVCGQHWCFHCGAAKTEHDIYDHMTRAHGGFFNDLDQDENETEEEG